VGRVRQVGPVTLNRAGCHTTKNVAQAVTRISLRRTEFTAGSNLKDGQRQRVRPIWPTCLTRPACPSGFNNGAR
jgi:hypothetical protein